MASMVFTLFGSNLFRQMKFIPAEVNQVYVIQNSSMEFEVLKNLQV